MAIALFHIVQILYLPPPEGDSDGYVSTTEDNGQTVYHKRPLSALYDWIKSKLDTVYLSLTGGTLTGEIFGNLTTNVNPMDITKTVAGDNCIVLHNTATGASCGIGILGNGTGVGIFDLKNNKWIINDTLDGAIYIGSQYCDGFSVAHGSDYIRFSNGVQLCWGTFRELSNNSYVAFPVAFATNIDVIATRNTSNYDAADMTVSDVTGSGFKINANGVIWGHWLAIGNWK